VKLRTGEKWNAPPITGPNSFATGSTDPWAQAISAKPACPVILDGGLATELEAQGHRLDNILWSAELLRSNPEALRAAHGAFLEAGAEIITSASYQASRAGFDQLGVAAAEADRLIASSVDLAREACDEYRKLQPDAAPRRVAASVGPYGAVLHDGSEYRGDYGVPLAILRMFHQPRLRLLDAAGADILAVETIPSIDEARVLAELLVDCKTPAWVSFCCRDGQSISDGTDIAVAAALFSGHSNVFAVGVNCTAPQNLESLIRRLKIAVPDKEIVAYPNSGESFDATGNRWSGDAMLAEFTASAMNWFRAGADYIGGCCRVRPAHIQALREAIVRHA
jgi:S-methylmethionine-dependent homocysteine/selenocysteine methylase